MAALEAPAYEKLFKTLILLCSRGLVKMKKLKIKYFGFDKIQYLYSSLDDVIALPDDEIVPEMNLKIAG